MMKALRAQEDDDSVPIKSLKIRDSPRLSGMDDVHVTRLAECEADLPPIIVHRQTMRVIDGIHRLQAAIRNGSDHVRVRYFDGSDDEAFMLAVELNVKHGLPLSLADRKAAARRIITAGMALSDRALASKTGLSGKTIAVIRSRSRGEIPQPDRRRGLDGRSYPISGANGRQRAAREIAERPGASLREIASAAGVSPTTVSKVRKSMLAGEDGYGTEPGSRSHTDANSQRKKKDTEEWADHKQVALQQLRSDPSVCGKEAGRELLRWLSAHVIAIGDFPEHMEVIPPHRRALVAKLASRTASAWVDFARRLNTAAQQNQ